MLRFGAAGGCSVRLRGSLRDAQGTERVPGQRSGRRQFCSRMPCGILLEGPRLLASDGYIAIAPTIPPEQWKAELAALLRRSRDAGRPAFLVDLANKVPPKSSM